MHVSNVALIDPELEYIIISKPTRVKYAYLEDGTRVRVSKKTGALIRKPEINKLPYEERVKDVSNL